MKVLLGFKRYRILRHFHPPFERYVITFQKRLFGFLWWIDPGCADYEDTQQDLAKAHQDFILFVATNGARDFASARHTSRKSEVIASQ